MFVNELFLCDKVNELTHWGRVRHICVGKLKIIGSDNGLLPRQRQAIIWTNAGIFLIRPLGKKISEILIKIHTFSFKKMLLKMSSGKWRPFCLGFNVLSQCHAWLRLGIRVSIHWTDGYFIIRTSGDVKTSELQSVGAWGRTYHQISDIRRTLVGIKIVCHSDVAGVLPVGAASTTSSFLN